MVGTGLQERNYHHGSRIQSSSLLGRAACPREVAHLSLMTWLPLTSLGGIRMVLVVGGDHQVTHIPHGHTVFYSAFTHTPPVPAR